jgi:F-type H+-transporting ATPase subunit b
VATASHLSAVLEFIERSMESGMPNRSIARIVHLLWPCPILAVHRAVRRERLSERHLKGGFPFGIRCKGFMMMQALKVRWGWMAWSLLLGVLIGNGVRASVLDVAMPLAMYEQGHGADGHHEVDLTHGHASSQLLAPVEWRTDKAIFSAIVFGLLLLGLYFAAWKKIQAALTAREEKIDKQIRDAKYASEEAQRKLAEYQQKLDSAALQAQEMLVQAKKDAEASGQRIVSEAQAEAQRQRDNVLAEIDAAKVAAIGEIGKKSTDLAFSLARSIVGREVKAEDHQQLIQEALRKLPSAN